MKLGDIMTAPPVTVREDASLDEVAARMIAHGIGCLPVVGVGGELVGIVTAADFGAKEDRCPFPPFCAPGFPGGAPNTRDHRSPGQAPLAARTAGQMMTLSPITLGEGATVLEAIAKMLHFGFDHIPVVRHGVPVGVVARYDLLRLTLRLLSGDRTMMGREDAAVSEHRSAFDCI